MATQNPVFTSSRIQAFVQAGCGETIYPVECLIPGDYTIGDSGTQEAIRCFINGKSVVRGHTVTPPDEIEFSLSGYLGQELNWIDRLIVDGTCNFDLLIGYYCPITGRLPGWKILHRFSNMNYLNKAITTGGDVASDTAITVAYNFNVDPSDIDEFYPYVLNSVPNSVYAYDLNAISFCEVDEICGADCNDDTPACSSISIGGDTDTTNGALALTMDSDCGDLELVSDTDTPIFALDTTNAIAALCFTGTGLNQQIFAAELDGVGEARISYGFDDDNYTEVDVTAVNDTFYGPNVLFTDNLNYIYAVTGLASINRSEDDGATWSVNYVADTFGAFTCGLMRNDSYGVVCGITATGGTNNGYARFMVTSDGGDSWSEHAQTAIADPIVSVGVTDSDYIFFTSTGKMYSSNFSDGFNKFTEISVPSASGNTGVTMSVNGCQIAVIYNNTGVGYFTWSMNGGSTWETAITETNTGFNDMARQGNSFYIVGAGGTTYRAQMGTR